jgi:hypothetical protein
MLNFMALYWPQSWKKLTIKFAKPIRNPLGANVPAFIGFAYQEGKDIVFRFILEYSSLRDFGP